MFLQFWALVVAGVVLLLVALVRWRREQRSLSLAFRRWMTRFYVALALCAGLSAVEQLANPRTFDLWSDLQLAALLLAGCALLVAGVYAVRETQRGSGMPR
jgi:hypothetical protein